VPVSVPQAKVPSDSQQLSAEVGRLLSPDPEVSRQAERRLRALDEQGRADLAAIARSIPDEDDPRWWNVLEEHHLLPPKPPAERLRFLLWKAERPEPMDGTKAQAGLLELARTSPDLLVSWLSAAGTAMPGDPAGRGADRVAIALAVARVDAAVPALLAMYRAAEDTAHRRAAAEALGMLLGDEHRPRGASRESDRRVEVAEIEAWWRSRPRPGVGGGPGHG
jgi:hypothetical protein